MKPQSVGIARSWKPIKMSPWVRNPGKKISKIPRAVGLLTPLSINLWLVWLDWMEEVLRLTTGYLLPVKHSKDWSHWLLSIFLFLVRHFEVGDKSPKDAAKLFSVPDFVGDACKAIASRIRGAVAGVQFDDFHKVMWVMYGSFHATSSCSMLHDVQCCLGRTPTNPPRTAEIKRPNYLKSCQTASKM